MPWLAPSCLRASCPSARSLVCSAARHFFGCCAGARAMPFCENSMNINLRGPQRIVCLTEESTETLCLLGEQDRIVGISGFTCRPKEARLKPTVSAFTSANIDKILELRPDLVIGFSDLQAQIAHDLIRAGLNVLITNQRSVEEILATILLLARAVGAEPGGLALVGRLRDELEHIAASAARFPRRPRVFFEEWMDPLISGI